MFIFTSSLSPSLVPRSHFQYSIFRNSWRHLSFLCHLQGETTDYIHSNLLAPSSLLKTPSLQNTPSLPQPPHPMTQPHLTSTTVSTSSASCSQPIYIIIAHFSSRRTSSVNLHKWIAYVLKLWTHIASSLWISGAMQAFPIQPSAQRRGRSSLWWGPMVDALHIKETKALTVL